MLALPLLLSLISTASSWAPADTEQSCLKALKRAVSREADPERFGKVEAALKKLTPFDSARTVAALVDAFLIMEKELRPLEEDRESFLAREAKDKKQELRVALLPLHKIQDALDHALRSRKSPTARGEMLRRALARSSLPLSLRRTLAKRGSLDPSEAIPLIRQALEHRQPALRVAGLDAAAMLPRKSATALGPLVLALLSDPEVSVRELSAHALSVLCLPQSIDPLLTRLEIEEGRAQTRIAAALEILTRQRLGTSIAAWRKWRAREGDAFVDGSAKLGGGTPSDPAAASAQYHGLPIEGSSILFVIDRSLSMRQKMGAKERATDPKEQRMFRAKSELKKTLDLLTPAHRFNILSFATTRSTFADELTRADRKTIKEAHAFVDGLTMEFGTQLYDAMQHAFLIAGRGSFDKFYDSQVETIYVLTDGRPYVGGKADSKTRIRNAVARWNSLDRVKVHVIGLGTDIPKKFLQGMADDNGGRFVHEKAAPAGG